MDFNITNLEKTNLLCQFYRENPDFADRLLNASFGKNVFNFNCLTKNQVFLLKKYTRKKPDIFINMEDLHKP